MMLDYDENCFYEEDKMGMTVTSGSVTLKKDANNLIGISIGGGAPLCPCLYVVQVFDNTPAAKEGTLQSGDEIVAVSGKTTKGKTKVEVAKMIQSVTSEVTINYNKLHADPKQGKTLDIVLKKVKHRIVDNMNSSTADALGLSRAILCNDSLVKKMEELSRNECIYRGLMEHTHRTLKAFFEVCHIFKQFGDVFAEIGVREPQPRASEAFTEFGEAHRSIEKHGIKLLKTVRPMLSDLHTYLNKAVPDTKLTVKKYADAKFEYLSYCLKVKEMDDEEYAYQALQEPLYRVETGNYEYRLILRCRQEARIRFAKLRADVLVKLELLDQKHVQDIVFQLQRLVSALVQYHNDCGGALKGTTIFPIEVDLSKSTFHYRDPSQPSPYQDGEDGYDNNSHTRGGLGHDENENDDDDDDVEMLQAFGDDAEQQQGGGETTRNRRPTATHSTGISTTAALAAAAAGTPAQTQSLNRQLLPPVVDDSSPLTSLCQDLAGLSSSLAAAHGPGSNHSNDKKNNNNKNNKDVVDATNLLGDLLSANGGANSALITNNHHFGLANSTASARLVAGSSSSSNRAIMGAAAVAGAPQAAPGAQAPVTAPDLDLFSILQGGTALAPTQTNGTSSCMIPQTGAAAVETAAAAAATTTKPGAKTTTTTTAAATTTTSTTATTMKSSAGEGTPSSGPPKHPHLLDLLD